MRCIRIDVRHHHNHIPWAELGIGTEAGEQLIVQHFHFALRTVDHVKAYRAILCHVDRAPHFAGLSQRAQFKNVALQLAQQA
ncbi:hypothetical protein D3C72_2425250 [compost metagenome]